MREIMCGLHTPCMGYPFPIVHAKWSRVFRSFATFYQRLKTALRLVYNNDNDWVMASLQLLASFIS